MSAMHSLQIAMSGGIIPEWDPVALGRMKKPSGISRMVPVTSTESIRESGGPNETAPTNSSNRSPRA